MIAAAIGVEFYLDGLPISRRVPLSPKAKYALVQFALRFEGRLCECGYEELAKQFGMSKQRMSAALKELVERGILEAHPKPEGRGRPINLYCLTPHVWQHLRAAQWSDMVAGERHWAAMKRLLGNAQVESSSELASAESASANQPKPLAIEDRLLLCVLLCHADRYGVARGLSTGDLRKLTGFGSDSLKDRLQRFVGLELIRAWVPGVTSHALFGKAKTVYYLNLQHPILESCYPLAGIMIFGWMHRWVEAYSLHTRLVGGWESLVHRSRFSAREGNPDVPQKGMDGDYAEMQIAGIGSQAESRCIVPMLQARLEIYASWLLSYRWDELDDQSLPCPKVLDEIIRRDFVEVRQKQKAELSRVADTLVGYIYTHAHGLALYVRGRLLRMQRSGARPQINYQEHEYLILPHDPSLKKWVDRSDDEWTRAVLLFSKGEFFSHGCYLPVAWYADESEIPLEQRYFYGLLTKPSGKAAAARPES